MPAGQQVVNYLQAEGPALPDPRITLPWSNWASIVTVTPGFAPPHSQTFGNLTTIMAISIVPNFSGIFDVSCDLAWSDNTTGDAVAHVIFGKQGAAAGALAGGLAASKFGSGAPSLATSVGSTAAGMVLNVDGNGGGPGNGITFEGLSPTAAPAQQQHGDSSGSLTGLLTANGGGSHYYARVMVDAVGSSSLVKTPFTLGKPACIAVSLTNTAAKVITYTAASLVVREAPIL